MTIQELMRETLAAVDRPGFGLRGWVGEDAYQAIVAEHDHDFPCGWDERDAVI